MASSETTEENMEVANADAQKDNRQKKNHQKKVKFDQDEQEPELEFDKSAYVLHHSANTGSPCLSFDVLPDQLGDKRTVFPLTAYLVAGTQAERARQNNVILMKMTNLTILKQDKEEDESDGEDSDSDDEEEPAHLVTAMIKHNGCVNRIRAVEINEMQLAATWSEFGKVYIWDLTRCVEAVNNPQAMVKYIQEKKPPKPIFSFAGHQTEGYAMDWSSTQTGYLATGDCRKCIHVWKPQQDGTWLVDQRPYQGHTDSVEDLQWSPNEANVLASCSVDKTIRIWDVRAPSKDANMLTVTAHESDVNVISWNKLEPLIVSGGDDGVISVWDLRQFQSNTAVATFKHHTAPITSVEWNPNEATVFAASGADDQISQWDLSVEKDSESMEVEEDQNPPQLLFVHKGQTEIKELHWHRQIPGLVISTANSGFNIFKTISV